MILYLWVVLLSLSLILLIIGRYIDQPPLILVGFMFLFLLGLTMLAGSVEYKVGVFESYSYENSSLLNVSKSDVFNNFSGEVIEGVQLHHVFGLFTCLVAAFGFILALFSLKAEGWTFK